MFSEDSPYGLVSYYKSSPGYAHMRLRLFNTFGPEACYFAHSLIINLECQTDSRHEKTYGHTLGVANPRSDVLTLPQLELATKRLKRLTNRLTKIQEKHIPTDSFAQYCHDVILASGVRDIFVNGNENGRYSNVIDLPRYKADLELLKAMMHMEAATIKLVQD